MRYLGLLVVLAILYLLYTRMSSVTPSTKDAAQEMQAVNPQASPAAQPANALKAPIDRTREVLDQVRKQKEADSY